MGKGQQATVHSGFGNFLSQYPLLSGRAFFLLFSPSRYHTHLIYRAMGVEETIC